MIAAAATVAVVLLHSSNPSCAFPAPKPDLPSQLKTIGGFDQPLDQNDLQGIDNDATVAATALHQDLIGSTVGSPVWEQSATPNKPDAVVIPLQRGGVHAQVVGLVSFLRDCSGRIYYSDVKDLVSAQLPGFPVVGAEQAQAQLQSTSVILEYVSDPFQPRWKDPTSGRTT